MTTDTARRPAVFCSGSIQISLSNLGVWADHLRFVDPKRFGGGDITPHLSEMVRWRMDILNQKYAATIPTLGLEFVAGVAAFTAYGRGTRRKMMRSLFDRSQIREYTKWANTHEQLGTT